MISGSLAEDHQSIFSLLLWIGSHDIILASGFGSRPQSQPSHRPSSLYSHSFLFLCFPSLLRGNDYAPCPNTSLGREIIYTLAIPSLLTNVNFWDISFHTFMMNIKKNWQLSFYAVLVDSEIDLFTMWNKDNVNKPCKHDRRPQRWLPSFFGQHLEEPAATEYGSFWCVISSLSSAYAALN